MFRGTKAGPTLDFRTTNAHYPGREEMEELVPSSVKYLNGS